MTLILGAITRDSVVLVSDRRLTDGRTGRIVTDKENKTVCIHGCLLAGYTGLAKLDRQPTHLWIANRFAGRDTVEAFRILRDDAAKAVRKYDRRHQWLAVLFVGWANRSEAKQDLIPCAFLVSNYMTLHGLRLAEPRSEFFADKITLGNRRSMVFSAGCNIEAQSLVELNRTIGRYAEASPGNPTGIANALAGAVSSVADKNSIVGKYLMIASLPRVAVPADQLIFGHNWQTDLAAAYYDPNGTTVQYAPTIVDRNGVVFSNMEVYLLPDGIGGSSGDIGGPA
jgi:hypothetical protein